MFDNEYFMLLNNSTYQSQLTLQCILEFKVPWRDRYDLLYSFGNFFLEIRNNLKTMVSSETQIMKMSTQNLGPLCGQDLFTHRLKMS